MFALSPTRWTGAVAPRLASLRSAGALSAHMCMEQGTAPEDAAAKKQNLGRLLVAGSLVTFLAFILALSSLLGWDLFGSADNNGIGVPLSTEEVRELQRKSRGDNDQTNDDDGRPLTAEEAAEDQAIMRVIMGAPVRAK